MAQDPRRGALEKWQAPSPSLPETLIPIHLYSTLLALMKYVPLSNRYCGACGYRTLTQSSELDWSQVSAFLGRSQDIRPRKKKVSSLTWSGKARERSSAEWRFGIVPFPPRLRLIFPHDEDKELEKAGAFLNHIRDFKAQSCLQTPMASCGPSRSSCQYRFSDAPKLRKGRVQPFLLLSSIPSST